MSYSLDLHGRMERQPYQTLLVAAGIGYVLGGGLFTRFTYNVLRIGFRVAAMPMLKQQMLKAAEAAMTPEDPLRVPYANAPDQPDCSL